MQQAFSFIKLIGYDQCDPTVIFRLFQNHIVLTAQKKIIKNDHFPIHRDMYRNLMVFESNGCNSFSLSLQTSIYRYINFMNLFDSFQFK